MPRPNQNLTQTLLTWGDGDEAARDALTPVVYDRVPGAVQDEGKMRDLRVETKSYLTCVDG